MRLALVGVGNAGCRIVNQILDVERRSGRNLCNGNTLLVSSAPTEFHARQHVPDENRLVIGDIHQDVDGHGTGGDLDLAAEIAREERNEIVRAFDLLEFYEVDGVLLAAGLGGGTGGGAGAVVLDELKNVCDKPVYAVGVLPSESMGSEQALNAARALQSFVSTADNVILFDNEEWSSAVASSPLDGESVAQANGSTGAEDAGPVADAATTEEENAATGSAADASTLEEEGDQVSEAVQDVPGFESAEEAFERMNVELATRIVTLFAAGEIAGPTMAENRMDPSDIMRTLDTGGISTIGYAARDVSNPFGGLREWLHARPWLAGILERFESDYEDEAGTGAARINRIVRRAARSKLTLPCDIASADRALIMLSGPPKELSRKGFEGGRYWLEQETDTVDVMAGDEPHVGSSTLTATILFSNVTVVPRIEAMQEQAVGGDSPDPVTSQRDEATP